MKTGYSKSGPFPERPYFTDSEIDRLCVEELRNVALLPSKPEPIRIDRFIEKKFGISYKYETLPVGVLGFTAFSKEGVAEIVISDAIDGEEGSPGERRLRSTLAHECGHGLMHTYLFAFGTKPTLFGDTDTTPKILCRDVLGESKPNRGYDGRWWELQANKAIGGLLMPRKLLLEALQPFTVSVGQLMQLTLPAEKKESAVQELARVFNVNPAVARIRIADALPAEKSAQLSL